MNLKNAKRCLMSYYNVLGFLLIGIYVITKLIDFFLIYNCSRRYKRMSDQRLAELETLLSLAKLKGRIVQMPIAFGKVDPARL